MEEKKIVKKGISPKEQSIRSLAKEIFIGRMIDSDFSVPAGATTSEIRQKIIDSQKTRCQEECQRAVTLAIMLENEFTRRLGAKPSRPAPPSAKGE